ncbi:hypothetical protein Hypma_003878 [Hypsizygus marmoreus]|uniref:Uncharacterized protein n=1 Tax=Hypsizygus marmoreus TaxID=39966 RepID=A0A369K0N6_HYPMA|nr:hypothetical protein Hypma_003878 [Hypsizygus marmoreus]
MEQKEQQLLSSSSSGEDMTVNHTNEAIAHTAKEDAREMEQMEGPPRKRKRRLPPHLRTSDVTMHDKRLKGLTDVLPEPIPPISLLAGPRIHPLEESEGSFSDADLQPLIASASGDAGAARNASDELGYSMDMDQYIETQANVFGLFRRYYGSRRLPVHDPEQDHDINNVSDIPTLETPTETPSPPTSSLPISLPMQPSSSFHPYPNVSSFMLGDWYWNGGAQKSQDDLKRLLSILANSAFTIEDIRNTNWAQINRQLAVNEWDEGEWADEDAGWRRQPVTIQVPFHRFTANPGLRDYLAANLYHRSLMSVIEDKVRNTHDHFHYEPFDLLWRSNPEAEPIQLHGECYSSSSFKTAHRELQNSPREPGCTLPRVVVALMFWSDATHLTNFGNAKLWPLYMAFGNESKYQRCKPSCNLFEHVAYFERLPDEFKDFVMQFMGEKRIPPELMAHCQREITHAQWRLLLDDAFIYAYEHGIAIECPDGQMRRFYPRIFTYSADYPEKILMAGIRQMGLCPCPRCKVSASDIHLIGTKQDRKTRRVGARVDDDRRRHKIKVATDAIFNENFAVDSAHVERQLKPESLVPTLNAFSDRLSRFGFNLYKMFAVDLMHEIEVGVWKAILIHLFRILEAVDENLLHELDKRFRQMPTFGRDTIRRFCANVSELKQMAARNYEDFLQCIMPVFQGLLAEPYNSQILRLLFHLAYWHGLAKLRMHSDQTLVIQDRQTTRLGDSLRIFQDEICPQFQTRELAREAAARKRRQTAAATAATAAAEHISRPAGPSMVEKDKDVITVVGNIADGNMVDGNGNVHTFNGDIHTQNEPEGNGVVAGVNAMISANTTTTTTNGVNVPVNSDGMGRIAPASSESIVVVAGMSAIALINATDGVAPTDVAPTDVTTAVAPSNIAPTVTPNASGRKPKTFSLKSYKAHALADYVETIREYGTTDSYSTESGELEHRTPKGRYKRTSKKAVQKQLAQIERRQARIRRIREKLTTTHPTLNTTASPNVCDPASHHHIGVSENFPQHIGTFLRLNSGDPAMQGFFQKLKGHLLPRLECILQAEFQGNANDSLDPSLLYFNKDTIYRHNILRINYTTYDVRRNQDSINPNTDHKDIMLLRDKVVSTSTTSHRTRTTTRKAPLHHQYRYGRVLGIYHVNIIYGGLVSGKVSHKVHRMEFLWIRWFELVKDVPVDRGWSTGQLDQLRFSRINHEGAFGFVDPEQVLRACHVIPGFSSGKLHPDNIGLSKLAQDSKDWTLYYVNRFVDRDMLMRFHWGLGVGHLYMRDTDQPDMNNPLPVLTLDTEETDLEAGNGEVDETGDGEMDETGDREVDETGDGYMDDGIVSNGDLDGAPQELSGSNGGDVDNGLADYDNDWAWEGRDTMSEEEEDGEGDDGGDYEEFELHKTYGAMRDRDPYSYD